MELLQASQSYLQSKHDASQPYVHSFKVTLVRSPGAQQSTVVVYPGSGVIRRMAQPRHFRAMILREILDRFPELERCSEVKLYRIEEKDGARVDLLQTEADVAEYLTEMVQRNDVGHLYVEGVKEADICWKHVVGAMAVIGLFGGLKSFCR